MFYKNIKFLYRDNTSYYKIIIVILKSLQALFWLY